MNSRSFFLVIAAVYIAGNIAHAFYLGKTVYGDGIFYYSWLRSPVFDRDADFRNEYRHFGIEQPETTAGFVRNKYSIGPAILWLPAYLIAHSLLRGSGFEFGYQLFISFTSVLFALTGLVLLYRSLVRFFASKIAAFTVAGIALATNLLFYGSLDTVNSHALSFFAASLFLALVTEPIKNWWAIGVSLGLIGLIRPQDFIYGLLLIPFAGKHTWKPLIAAFVMFLPQLAAWQALYGTVLVHPYFLEGEGFQFLRPHIASVLFSQTNGLFLWTPILFFSLLGFILHMSRHKGLKIAIPVIILLAVIIVSSWSTWWQGASYGGRMFVSILPLFAVGLANFLLHAAGWVRGHVRFLRGFVGLFAVLNVCLILFFLLSET